MSANANDAMSRRGSLLTIGGAGLAALALAASPKAAIGKKRKKSRKRCPRPTEDCTAQCAQQVDQTCAQLEGECNTFFAPLCAQEDAPRSCTEILAGCCALLGECQAAPFLDCFLRATRGAAAGNPP